MKNGLRARLSTRVFRVRKAFWSEKSVIDRI
jgi:hypothetical protein